MERARLPSSFVFHSLRHTYTSQRLLEGVSPLAVARQLGHQSIATVMEIYAHCADDFIDREIRTRFRPILGRDQELLEMMGEGLSIEDVDMLQLAKQGAPHLRIIKS
jgi:hypothetical protein